METQDESKANEWKDVQEHRHPVAGRVLGGLVLVGIGAVWFMQKMGYLFPAWLFSWKMLLIVIGLYVGARHVFRGVGWLIPIIIGLLFMADDFIPGFNIKPFIWPIVIVIAGLFMIFRPRRCGNRWRHKRGNRYNRFYNKSKWEQPYNYSDVAGSTEDRLEAVVVFGGTKKNIISKDFKGGEVTCVFGGAEINLSQADINGKVVLEMNQVFGGTKLIVPSHWQVHPETVTFMGGIEDRRPDNKVTEPNKILILKGTSVFGGIDISSY
jgi:predicted membrane protein